MKKTLKKTLSLALALMMIFSVALTASAAGNITKEQAQEIALKDAGYTADEVIYIKAEYDVDRGVEEWDVEFLVEDGRFYKEYGYEIRISDGRILEKDWDYEDDYYGQPNLAPDAAAFDFQTFWNAFVAWFLSWFN